MLKTLRVPKKKRANTMVMVLAIMVTFSTIAIGLSQLIQTMAVESQLLIAQSKVEYAAHSGLIHMNTLVVEDVGKSLSKGIDFVYQRRYCVAWVNREGKMVCDEAADPQDPCCRIVGLQCIGNSRGVCTDNNRWVANYQAAYDSISQSITSSGYISFENLGAQEGLIYSGDRVNFTAVKEMDLAWE